MFKSNKDEIQNCEANLALWFSIKHGKVEGKRILNFLN